MKDTLPEEQAPSGGFSASVGGTFQIIHSCLLREFAENRVWLFDINQNTVLLLEELCNWTAASWLTLFNCY